jgi:hypothetical protein
LRRVEAALRSRATSCRRALNPKKGCPTLGRTYRASSECCSTASASQAPPRVGRDFDTKLCQNRSPGHTQARRWLSLDEDGKTPRTRDAPRGSGVDTDCREVRRHLIRTAPQGASRVRSRLPRRAAHRRDPGERRNHARRHDRFPRQRPDCLGNHHLAGIGGFRKCRARRLRHRRHRQMD